jgi:Protein of unknown function (DUF2934)
MTADRQTEIANRAYLIWEREGRLEGKALDHWLQAEAELADALAAEHAPASPSIQAAKPQRPEQAPARPGIRATKPQPPQPKRPQRKKD